MRWTALAAALALGASAAQASPCCLSANAFGIGRLSPWEDAAAISGLGVSPSIGWWDANGRFVGDARGTSDVELRAQLAAVVALHSGVELSGKVPWLLNRRSADGLTEVGAGAGDGALGLRLELAGIGEHGWLPGIAFNAGVTLPLGRPMSASRSLLASDVTGRGAWALSGAFTFEEVLERWYLQLNVGATVPLPMDSYLPGVTQRFGPLLDVSLAAGRELTPGLVLSLMASFTLEGALELDGVAVRGSDARLLAISPSLSWKFSPHWTVQAGVDSGLFLLGFGANRQGRVGMSAALRYGFF